MSKVILFLRSLIFNMVFYPTFLFNLFVATPVALVSKKWAVWAVSYLIKPLIFFMKYLVGIKVKVEGMEHLPQDSGCIIACKHQSAIETVVMFNWIKRLAYVYKKELAYIPIFGWYNVLLGNIKVDRSKGMSALRDVIKQIKVRVSENRRIMIFPEGTRIAVGETVKYKPAVYSAYAEGVTIVPAALNTGLFWPRDSFVKYSGTAVIRLLPAIEKGLTKKEFYKRLQGVIEENTADLVESYPRNRS